MDLSYNDADDTIDDKEAKIEKCLARERIDLWELRELALTRGGLVKPQWRQKAWALLVGAPSSPAEKDCSDDSETSKRSQEYDLIQRDAGRSVMFRYLCNSPVSVAGPIDNSNTPEKKLVRVLETAITKYGQGMIHYYQGLHDIGGLLLHNLDYSEDEASLILGILAKSHLRDALRDDFGNVMWLLDNFLFPLIRMVDPEVEQALVYSDVGLSNAVLPWIITWCLHDIHDQDVASRLVDAFISSHPLFPLYLSVSLLVHPFTRNEILFAEPDPASMHVTIQSLPSRIRTDWTKDALTAQDLINDALATMKRVPPRSLLDLAEGDRSLLRDQAASIATLRIPKSWALASFSGLGLRFCGSPEPNGYCPCRRAKLASGVKILMESVDSAGLPTSRSTPKQVKKAPSRWQLYRKIFMSTAPAEGEAPKIPRTWG